MLVLVLVLVVVIVVVGVVDSVDVVVGEVDIVQSQGRPAQGHASAGKRSQTVPHLSSVVPKTSTPGVEAARHLKAVVVIVVVTMTALVDVWVLLMVTLVMMVVV